MNKMRYFIVLILCLGFLLAEASHNRAGEITYVQVDDLTIIATITTYTKSSSIQADKDSVLLDWGDGTSNFVKRTNGNGVGVELANNVKFNTYVMEHTYPARATYTMCMVDPNRVAEIQNLNFPNSSNIRFSIQTTFTLVNVQFNGTNSSVQLLQPPIDLACVGEVFIHTPNAYDPDQGDSLAFELTTPYQECGEFVDDYVLPDQILPDNNDFSFDTTDGTIVWNSPQKAGEYNVAFFVYEYRDGVLLNTVLRDMQIFVFNCDNPPPVITAPDEICVIAGDTVDIEITIDDASENQLVITEGTGAPFLLDINPATLTPAGEYLAVPYTVNFKWATRCNDISDNSYNVVIRAADNFFNINNQTSGLADLHTISIKVVGPPPEDPQIEPIADAIRVDWELPYACEITDSMFFQGFSVWRKEEMATVPLDTCDAGIEGFGYVEIGTPAVNIDDGRYFYIDEEVEKGKTYCYRIVAEFAQISVFGFPYNFVQSLRSEEVCAQLPRDIPLLTEVSILTTDQSNGRISISYIKPDPVQLDTMENPGPYRYQLQRSAGIDGTSFIDIPGASFISPQFSSDIPLNFIDENLDTESQGYAYRVAFFADGTENFFDNSPVSSSVYLTITPNDERNDLTWDYNTSWINDEFFIYKLNDISGIYELIDSTMSKSYQDDGLVNGIEYCYYVQSHGTYQVPELDFDIFNDSNESCQTPIDTVAPCVPELEVSNTCDDATEDAPEEFFVNTLEWNRVDISCPNSQDIAAYNIYFKNSINATDIELIATITDIQVISYEDDPDIGLTACYAISSVDSTGNESELSEFICVEDCPAYILPNAFTPNFDGDNDFFIPILSRFVVRVNFQVYNEWGQRVFETTDPMINWDGTTKNGSKLNDGVYYYTCEVFQATSTGETASFDFLKGSIYLLN